MGRELLFHLDFDLAVKRFKRDIRDDWFPDPLQFKDILDVNKIENYFSSDPRAFFGEVSEQFAGTPFWQIVKNASYHQDYA